MLVTRSSLKMSLELILCRFWGVSKSSLNILSFSFSSCHSFSFNSSCTFNSPLYLANLCFTFFFLSLEFMFYNSFSKLLLLFSSGLITIFKLFNSFSPQLLSSNSFSFLILLEKLLISLVFFVSI